VLPLTHLFQQTENVLRLAALITFERTVILIVLFWKWNYVIFYLAQYSRTDIERNLKLFIWSSIIVVVSQICDLQLDFAEFSNNIVETVAKDWILLMLIYLEVQLLEELVLSFNQFFLANAEQNGNL
jgi:hypothetical protein